MALSKEALILDALEFRWFHLAEKEDAVNTPEITAQIDELEKLVKEYADIVRPKAEPGLILPSIVAVPEVGGA